MPVPEVEISLISEWLDAEAARDPGRKGHAGGTERLVSPADTVERLRPQLAGLGITRLGNLTGLDNLGIPVFMSTRPLARAVAVSLGKGISDDAAMASALMESIETWHAERIDAPLILRSLADMRGHRPVIDTSRLCLRPGRVFPEHEPVPWIEAVDILASRPVWLPYEIVHTDYRSPALPGSGAVIMSTNGLASGNHRLEALLHALLELVERDAMARLRRMSLDGRAQRLIDPDAVEDPVCAGLIARLRDADCDLAIYDIALRFDIPAYYVRLGARDRLLPLAEGAGCHGDPAIALSRALTEAAQVRTTYISGARDDLKRHEFSPESLERDAEFASAIFAARGHRRLPPPPPPRETFADELDHLLARLVADGIEEVAMVDMSGPVDHVFVVRAVVPGLRRQEMD